MAKQANRMMIGGFVVIALFILAASLAVFGSGKFFTKTVNCVMYFDGSISGLSVGAPVLFQGVQIGTVVSINLQVYPSKMQVLIPVVIGYEPDRFNLVEDGQRIRRDPRVTIPKLIERGLRARLTTQSFITGQLAIELDFFPNTPVVLRNISKEYIEIPTIPSTAQRLAQALGRLDLEKIEKKFTESMDGVSKLVNNPNLAPSILSLRETLQSTHKFITRVDGKVDPLTKNMNKMVKDFRRLANDLDARVNELTANLDRTLAGLDKTLSGFDKTMTGVRAIASPNAPLVANLENSLQEITAMSRSIRELADYLEMHPESLIRGKKKPKGQ